MPMNSAAHFTVCRSTVTLISRVNKKSRLIKARTLCAEELSIVKWMKRIKNALRSNTTRSSRFEARMYSGGLSENVNKNMSSLLMGIEQQLYRLIEEIN